MRFNDILLEYDRGQTLKNYAEKILAVALKDRSVIHALIGRFPDGAIKAGANTPEGQQLILDYVMGVIEQSDPTKNKNYAQAITRMYTLGGTMLEDIESTLSQYLIKFDKLKNKKKIPAPQNDFMRYKSLDEFMSVVEQLPDPDSEIEQQKIGAVQLPPDRDWRYVYGRMDEQGRITTDCLIIQPLTKFGGYWWAKEYPKKGVTNRWCTAWEGDNSRFDYYAKQGPLFIIIPAQRTDDNEKYQFHFETKQFMDYQDHQIGDEGMDQLAKRFPALQTVFKSQAIKYNLLGLMTDEYKAAVRGYSREASTQLANLIGEYKNRIAVFGFKYNLSEYGITIDENTQAKLMPLIESYIDLAVQALSVKDGVWSKIVQNLGSERNESKLEVYFNTDATLKKLSEESEAGKAIKEVAADPAISRIIDASHLQDLLLRDPFFRFSMRQIPELYKEFLDELDAKHLREHIVKVSGGYELKSKHGNKNLGKYPTKAGAEKRERQVQYFKHVGEEVVAEGMTDRQQFNDYQEWKRAASQLETDDDGQNYVKLCGKLIAHWRGNDGWVDSSTQGVAENMGQNGQYQKAFRLGKNDAKQGKPKQAPWGDSPSYKASHQGYNDGYTDTSKQQGVAEENEYGDLGDDDGVAEGGFFVVIASEHDGAFVGMVTKDGGRWRESAVAGDAPGNWGGNYMSYLTPDDVMQHIRNDYRRSQVKGPFYAEDQAMEYAQRHFDLGDDSDYFDDEDDLEEGRVKDFAIQKGERDDMTPQQFRGQYGKTKGDWDAENKGMFTSKIKPAAKKSAAPKKTARALDYCPTCNREDNRCICEDDWHSDEVGDSWHGGGNEPKDAWHGADGGAAVGDMMIGETKPRKAFIRPVKRQLADGNSVTEWELIAPNGATIKANMSRDTARSLLKAYLEKHGNE